MRLLIKEDVVDLGIIVGNAQGQLSGVKQIGESARFVLHGQQPVQFITHHLRDRRDRPSCPPLAFLALLQS